MPDNESKGQCVGCGEETPREELIRVGLVLLCKACVAESEAIQSLQAEMLGGCGGSW